MHLMRDREIEIELDTRVDERQIRRWEIWEMFWRYLALIQLLVILYCVYYFLTRYFNGDTIINVESRNPPGKYAVTEIASSDFINQGIEVLNLIATYQPNTVADQFKAAKHILTGEALAKFEAESIAQEMPSVERSGMTQIFSVESLYATAERDDEKNTVKVRIPGIREKFIGRNLQSREEVLYSLEEVVGEPSPNNEYGLLISKIAVEARPLSDSAGNSRIIKKKEEDKYKKKKKKKKAPKPLQGLGS
jgi:hypothetical protein